MTVVTKIKRGIKRGIGSLQPRESVLRNSLCLFLYHEVSDQPSPFCQKYDLNVSPALFDKQIHFIRNAFNVIDIHQLLEGNYDTPAAMVMFDDGFLGYFHKAVPILEKMRIHSINFLNMSSIEGEMSWEALVAFLINFDQEFSAFLKEKNPKYEQAAFKLCTPRIVADYLNKIADMQMIKEKVVDFTGPKATMRDLKDFENHPLVAFGNHLYNHYNATHLTDYELKEQYSINHDKMTSFKNGGPFFSFPFGEYLDRQISVIETFGAKAVFTSSGNMNRYKRGTSFDRIGLNSSVHTMEDLIGRIQWFKLRKLLKIKRSF